jgi:hypothetical protein
MEDRKAGRSKNFTTQMVVNMEGNIDLPIVTKVNTFPLRWESVWEETKAWKKEGRAVSMGRNMVLSIVTTI